MKKDSQIIAWQRVEGLALLLMGVVIFGVLWGNWWFFFAILLVPDMGMLGFLFNSKIGALSYNLFHMLALPVLLIIISVFTNGNRIDSGSGLFLAAMVWFAHIGMDRMLGYGLKYDDGFKHTHLGLIGKK